MSNILSIMRWTRRALGLLAFAVAIQLIVGASFSSAWAVTTLVRQQAELDWALKNARGGDVIQLSRLARYSLSIKSRNFTPEITITSEIAEQPAIISTIAVFYSSGIRIVKVNIGPSGLPGDKKVPTVQIIRCHNIAISQSKAIGSAKEYLTLANLSEAVGEGFALIRWSSGIALVKNVISGFNQGIAILESTDVRISNNEITKLQGDGIRMGGIRGLLISDNRIHDFLGSDQTVNHSDMIQLWSTNAQIVSGDIVIVRNRLLSGNGPATQTIFMRNEQVDHSPENLDRYYTNITISDNLIHNGHLHGITVGETNGLTILNNTLLPNPKSTMGIGNDRKMWPPTIRIAQNSTKVLLTRNVTYGITAPAGAVVKLNYMLFRDDRFRALQLAKLFMASSFFGAQPDAAYMARPDSTLVLQALGSILTREPFPAASNTP